jgi:hypothetical protein
MARRFSFAFICPAVFCSAFGIVRFCPVWPCLPAVLVPVQRAIGTLTEACVGKGDFAFAVNVFFGSPAKVAAGSFGNCHAIELVACSATIFHVAKLAMGSVFSHSFGSQNILLLNF